MRGFTTPPPHPVKRWQQIILAIALVALWGVVLLGLRPVFVVGAWWIIAWALAASVVGAAAIAKLNPRTSARRAATIGTSAGGAVWIAWFVLNGRLGAWIASPGSEAADVQGRIVAGVAPLRVGGALEDILLATVVVVASVAAVLLVHRCPLVAGVLTTLLLLVPIAVSGFSTSAPVLLVAGTLLALLAWAGSPNPRPIGLVSAGAAVAVSAGVLAVAPVGRDRVWNSAVLFAPVSITVPDVTVALAEDLRERSDTVAFRGVGLVAGAHRFTLATLTDFEDGVWLPQFEVNDEGHTVTVPRSSWTLEQGAILDGGFTWPENSTIIIEGLRSTWLPMPQATVAVSGLGDFDETEWQWVEASATARSESSITRDGDQYRVVTNSVRLDDLLVMREDENSAEFFAQLAPGMFSDADAAPAEYAPYLELPGGIPEFMRESARSVTDGTTTAFGAALALQDFFRSGEFAYDESAPYNPGADPGDPYAVMSALLEQRSGFCVHYASTFAVMARELGIPTRLAVGYAAKQASNDSAVEVRGTDLHAWPEVFIAEFGWIAFEPTPGGAGLRADRNIDTPATPETPPEPRERPTPTAPLETSPFKVDTQDGAQQGGSDADAGKATWWLAIGAAVVLALASPAMVRAVRRARRRAWIDQGDRPAMHAWAELTDTMADLGSLTSNSRDADVPGGIHTATDLRVGNRPRAQTPYAVIEYLESRGQLGGVAAEAARAIAERMEAERYGRGADGAAESAGNDDLAGLLAAARAELRASATKRARLTAAVTPRSVFRRRARREVRSPAAAP